MDIYTSTALSDYKIRQAPIKGVPSGDEIVGIERPTMAYPHWVIFIMRMYRGVAPSILIFLSEGVHEVERPRRGR